MMDAKRFPHHLIVAFKRMGGNQSLHVPHLPTANPHRFPQQGIDFRLVSAFRQSDTHFLEKTVPFKLIHHHNSSLTSSI
jgi:hypothetical protein